MAKLYNIFENSLKESINEFKNKKYFSYIGIIGSLNTNRDLDIVIIPDKNVKPGLYLKTIVGFLEVLKLKLRKRIMGLVVFMHTSLEEEVKWISKRNSKKDILLHIVGIFGWPHLKEMAKKIIINGIKSTQKTYYGRFDDVKKFKNFNPNVYYTYLFL